MSLGSTCKLLARHESSIVETTNSNFIFYDSLKTRETELTGKKYKYIVSISQNGKLLNPELHCGSGVSTAPTALGLPCKPPRFRCSSGLGSELCLSP